MNRSGEVRRILNGQSFVAARLRLPLWHQTNSKDLLEMLHFSSRLLATVFILPLIALVIYCLGANSKWIGVRVQHVRVVGLPVRTFRNARLYECFGTEEAVLTAKTPDTDFHSIEFVTVDNTNELILRLKVTGDDYLVDWFDRTTAADYVLLEYEDPLGNQTQREVFRIPSKSGNVTIDFTPNKP